MRWPVVVGGETRTPFGIAFAAGATAMTAAAVSAAVLFGETPARLAVVGLAVAAYAAIAEDGRAALATAGLGYLLFDGFLVNRYGELVWDGRTSVCQLLIFGLAAVVGHSWRWIRRHRRWAALDRELAELLITDSIKEVHGA